MDVRFLDLIERVKTFGDGSAIPISFWVETSERIRDFLVPKQTYGEDRPPDESDFKEHRASSTVGLKCLEALVMNLERLPNVVCNKNFVVSALIFCGEHTDENPWTTTDNIATSEHCLHIIALMCNCPTVSDLFICESIPGLYRLVLLALRPKLLKTTWKFYPAAVQCYSWSLSEVFGPDLAVYLGDVLPTALLLLDDHVIERRLHGITCILHIMHNVTRTELCSRGWNNVLFHAFEPLIHTRDPDLILPAYTCMTTLLGITELGYTRSVAPGEWSRLESTLVTLLDNMEFEDRILLRLHYMQALCPLLQTMGPAVIQLSRKLLCVFEDYLDKQTPDTRHFALSAFFSFIYNIRARLAFNAEKVTYLLLKTLYDVSKAFVDCEFCRRNIASLIEEALSEVPLDDRDPCPQHQYWWVEDLRTINQCLNFVKYYVPYQFEDIREGVVKHLRFNPLMTNILKHAFKPS